jgi:galactitol-specific phosphotransferase system IIB component
MHFLVYKEGQNVPEKMEMMPSAVNCANPKRQDIIVFTEHVAVPFDIKTGWI